MMRMSQALITQAILLEQDNYDFVRLCVEAEESGLDSRIASEMAALILERAETLYQGSVLQSEPTRESK